MEAADGEVEHRVVQPAPAAIVVAGTDRASYRSEHEVARADRATRTTCRPACEPVTARDRLLRSDQAFAFSNGAHVCEVEVDPDTGVTRIVSYIGVDDIGTVVNPMVVEGQVHGAIAQGIGQALFEAAGL